MISIKTHIYSSQIRSDVNLSGAIELTVGSFIFLSREDQVIDVNQQWMKLQALQTSSEVVFYYDDGRMAKLSLTESKCLISVKVERVDRRGMPIQLNSAPISAERFHATLKAAYDSFLEQQLMMSV